MPPVIGKLIVPLARLAVPTVPGVRPSWVRAPVKPESSATAELPPGAVCDELLSRIVTGRTDDDVAILAVRLHPVDAGPVA